MKILVLVVGQIQDFAANRDLRIAGKPYAGASKILRLQIRISAFRHFHSNPLANWHKTCKKVLIVSVGFGGKQYFAGFTEELAKYCCRQPTSPCKYCIAEFTDGGWRN